LHDVFYCCGVCHFIHLNAISEYVALYQFYDYLAFQVVQHLKDRIKQSRLERGQKF
jgi:hypothetical protein